MKNRVFKFDQWINEQKKLNEGGGAGISFKMDGLQAYASWTVTKDEIKLEKIETKKADTFNAEGYDDGMSDVASWLLKLDDKNLKEVTLKSLNSIDLKFNYDGDKDKFLESNGVKPEDFDKVNTIEDLFEIAPNAKFKLEYDFAFDYDNMLFGGWVRGDVKDGTVIMSGNDKADFSDNSTVRINEDDLHWKGDDYLSTWILENAPVLVANKRFVDFYNSIFKNDHEEFTEYSKEEILYKVTEEDDYNDAATEYMGTSDKFEKMSLDDFKKNAKEYIEDFTVWVLKDESKYTVLYGDWMTGVQEEYQSDEDPRDQVDEDGNNK